MANEGEFSTVSVLESGDSGRLNYQAAKVRKPLCAVSTLNRKGNPCWFDGEQSHIIPAKCPELNQIRALIAKATGKIPMHLDKGIFKMKTWVKPENVSPFQGQDW